MTRKIKTERLSVEEDLRQQLYVLLQQSAGGDPSHLLILLELIVKTRAWEGLRHSFVTFITLPFDKGGVGWSLENVRAVIAMKHRDEAVDPAVAARMAVLRQEVENLLIAPAKSYGGKRPARKQADNVRLKKNYGNSRAALLSRLKRDRPDLAQQVLSGKLSANAAAISAGFRHKSLTIYPDDAERTVRILRRQLTHHQLVELIDKLLA